jgi:cobyrinic acid a,c-diamide synthase
MIAAPRSGSGKTTATLGLLRAFKRRGVDVVGLKSGPDYIDPAFHAAASGREGVNLDSWAMAPTLLAALAARAAGQSALALCEASMGLFDGVPAESGRTGASADVAAALGMPVLLVIDVTGQAQSAAAIVKGCASYDERLKVAGVIVNRVGSERHRRLVVEAIEAMGVSVVGALPRNDTIALPERHLGLVQAGETEALEARLEAIADFIETQFSRRDSASRLRATRRSRSSIRIWCKAGERPGPRSSHSRRWPTSLRLPIVICAGFPAAIRNCMRDDWRLRRAFVTAYVASLRRVRCTANAGAIWRWAKASSTLRASPIRWRTCWGSKRVSRSAG